MRYCYGVKRRSDGEIVRMPLADIKASFKTLNLTYVKGEIYRRPIQGNLPYGEWELHDVS